MEQKFEITDNVDNFNEYYQNTLVGEGYDYIISNTKNVTWRVEKEEDYNKYIEFKNQKS